MAVGILAACSDGHASTSEDDPNLDASVTITCTSDPDAATPLGVRGADLWNAFARVYTMPFNRPVKKGFETATFTLTVERTDRPTPGLDDCSTVAVPVLVTVQSDAPMVNEPVLGTLSGSLLSAQISFATPEYVIGFEPHLYGNLRFEQGQPVQVRLRTDSDGYWYAPPLQEAP